MIDNLHIDHEVIPQAWLAVLPQLQVLADAIAQHLQNEPDIRPKSGLWYEALRQVAPQDVGVVILGQDPYHGEYKGIHQAHGLAFSVPAGLRAPPSLRNILSELKTDIGAVSAQHGHLAAWCEQGVLLLNAALTTRAGQAGAHRALWKPFTQLLLAYLGKQPNPCVFILWGAHAQTYKPLIAHHHVVIESAHPSPLSSYRGFFGSKPFSLCNRALTGLGKQTIQW